MLLSGLSAVEMRLDMLLRQDQNMLGPRVPGWVRYSEEQAEMFASPEIVEQDFAKQFGENLSERYLDEFSEMLQRIDSDYVNELSAGLHIAKCSVVIVKYRVGVKDVAMSSVLVRPCAENLGIFKIVLLRFVQSCSARNKEFVIEGLADKTFSMLKGVLQIEGDNDEFSYSVDVEKLPSITAQVLGIAKKLSSVDPVFELKASEFPTSVVMNSNQRVINSDRR